MSAIGKGRERFKLSLTAEELRSRLHYDPETGVFTWIKSGRAEFVGRQTGFIHSSGYVIIRFGAGLYKAHRLAFLYMTGEWPKETVDHRNRDKADNRWANLREATPSQNAANSPLSAANKIGFKGITRNPSGTYTVRVRLNYKLVVVGTFPTLIQARYMHTRAHTSAFGEFSHS